MTPVLTDPTPVAASIRAYVAGRDELLKDDYEPDPELAHPLAGHCYVASEAFYHLNGGSEKWVPQYVEVPWEKNGTRVTTEHWFLKRRDGSKVLDLTAEQFTENGIEVPYYEATGRGFLPPTPSQRAKQVMEAATALTA